MNLELKDKRVLITGASRGIGAATALAFLQEGAKTYIVSRGSDQLYQTKKLLIEEFDSNQIVVDECDCTNPSSLLSLKERIQNSWNGLDIVISNIGDGQSVADQLPDEIQWEKTWKKNFDSALYTARTFLPMLKESRGCLLFISSIAGKEAFGAPVDYSTAKTALFALAKNMARKLGNEVRVNVIAPGNITFPGGSWDIKMKDNPDAVNQIIRSSVPMNRLGKPHEIADSVVFICSERASFITGSVLVIDGGQTVGVF